MTDYGTRTRISPEGMLNVPLYIADIGIPMTDAHGHQVYSDHVKIFPWPDYQAVCGTCDKTVGPIRKYLRVAERDAYRHHHSHAA